MAELALWNNTPVTTKEINVTADGAEKVITLTATASGKVQPKFSTTTGWNIDWLAHDAASYKSEVVDGVTTSTMTFKYTLTADAPYVPVTLTLANESASQDESVYTKLTIVPPATAPVLDFATPEVATGNFNLYDDANKKITLYKTSKSSITLGTSCPFGTKLVLSNNLPWLEVAKATTGPASSGSGTPATDVHATTPVEEFYTLKLKDTGATSSADSKFEIINLGDDTKKVELTVELLDPAITTIELTGTTNGATYNDFKITNVPRTAAGTLEVKVTSPQGVTASTLSSWFTIAETTTFTRAQPTDATGSQTFTLTVKDAVTDFTTRTDCTEKQHLGVKWVEEPVFHIVHVWLPGGIRRLALVKVVVSAIVNHDDSVLAVTPCGEVTFTSRVPAAVRGTLVILKSL